MKSLSIEDQAKYLASQNIQADPEIRKIYWFPDDKEIHLIELEDSTVPALSGHVEPFYFSPSPEDNLTSPSGIAIIQTKEFGNLKLPKGWGSWNNAVKIKG